MNEARLQNVQAIRQFITAGDATITLVSRKTGTRFTYRIKAQEKEGQIPPIEDRRYFASVLTGADNETCYTYIGMLNPALRLNRTKASKLSFDTPSVKALTFLLVCLYHSGLPHAFEVWHEGKCGRCGRKLTVPESIANGIGPTCASQLFA